MINNNSVRKELIINFVSQLLITFGEDISREGLIETPQRVFNMYEELLSGYLKDPRVVFKTFKSNDYKDLIAITNIRFHSLCEHHMIPFFGKIHIGYVPNGKVLGLSKFVRLTEILSHRLQTQENLTNQIANVLEENLKPRGLAVTIEAEHLCMSMRGVKKSDCLTKTTILRGLLKKDSKLTNQFYREINNHQKDK
jgi:GTP cyclohydrolase I